MVYFVKTTKKGLLVAEQPTGTFTTNINGVERKFYRASNGKLGFIACVDFDPEELDLEKGAELKFTITDKPVISQETKEVIPNLYWATEEI